MLLSHGYSEVSVELERERKQLLDRDAEWADVSSTGRDVERILSFWSDDAQVFAPGLPVFRGKAALRSYVEGALAIPGFRISWTTSEANLSPDGQMAYLRSSNSVTMPGSDGRLITTRGRAVTVWRREPDGIWRCVIDIWNDEPART
jgi:ketosteroid isomerase-like protein